jgi:hypothetical protein
VLWWQSSIASVSPRAFSLWVRAFGAGEAVAPPLSSSLDEPVRAVVISNINGKPRLIAADTRISP